MRAGTSGIVFEPVELMGHSLSPCLPARFVPSETTVMADLIYIGIVVVFFAVSERYVRACAQL